MQIIKDDYYITDETSDINIKSVKLLLSKTYWAEQRSFEIIKESIKHSVCFSLYKKNSQIGFARVVTDYSTFSYLADVIIDNKYRSNGLGKWFVETIIEDKRWCNLLQLLATKDAHKLYEKFGFEKSEKLMMRKKV